MHIKANKINMSLGIDLSSLLKNGSTQIVVNIFSKNEWKSRYIANQCCPVKNSRFFTSFRMTDYYILFVRDGGRLVASPPTDPHLQM